MGGSSLTQRLRLLNLGFYLEVSIYEAEQLQEEIKSFYSEFHPQKVGEDRMSLGTGQEIVRHGTETLRCPS